MKCCKSPASVSSKEQRDVTSSNAYENVAGASRAPVVELLDNPRHSASATTGCTDDVQYVNTGAVNISVSPDLNQNFGQRKASEYESIDDALAPVNDYAQLTNEMNSEYQGPYTALSGRL